MPDISDANERLIKGCQVYLPETVFYNDGRIDFVATIDKDCCLALDTKLKLQNLEIRKKLEEIVKERLKDCEMHGKEQAVHRKQKTSSLACVPLKNLSVVKRDVSIVSSKSKREEKN